MQFLCASCILSVGMKRLLSYDHSLMFADKIGDAGFPDSDLPRFFAQLTDVRDALVAQWRKGTVGFFSIPDQKKELQLIERLAKDIVKRFKTLIVVGIGGSDLGARAVLRALAVRGKGMDVRFIGANTDPEEIDALLCTVDLRKCAINVISKSGDTIEPMSTFLLLRDRLIKKVGAKRHAAHIVATTDETSGTLCAIARREGYRILPVPSNIGGRFSVLTTVGLFPAACAGVSARRLLAGAEEMRGRFVADAVEKNAPLLFAGLHCDGYLRRAQNITVMMPYADALRDVGTWFRQLWAESLGKSLDRRGRVVHYGMTPIAALGATDQHSQIQLYNEGPLDKIVTFIEVDRFRKDFTVPKSYADIEGVAYMAGHTFEQIIHAERESTAQALAKNGRPNGTLYIPAVTPESLGGLFFFFMLATAAAAEIFDVDAYDQPGVEEGKRVMYRLLGRKSRL